MGIIRVLPPSVADKIAAGEVVERPASVVKELVENSIDAGARSVVAEIEGGGCALIRVTDDGCGMFPEDLENAIVRHATSKIGGIDDLFAVRSLGFRGEALPSIVSVSRTVISSRRPEAETGRSIEVVAGEVISRIPRGMSAGTVVEVRDLFFNTPARKKFLKTPATELRNIMDIMTRFGLAYPALRFLLTIDGRRVVDLVPGGDMAARCGALLGRELSRRMLSLEWATAGMSVTGLVSPPGDCRRNRGGLYMFVNRRPVRDNLLASAILEGYAGYTVKGTYPIAVVFVDTDPADVDVNVHPAKAEVRFSRPQAVFSLVCSAVRRALQAPAGRPVQSAYPEACAPRDRGDGLPSGRARGDQERLGTTASCPVHAGSPYHDLAERVSGYGSADGAASGFRYGSLTFIGTLHAAYLLLSDRDALYILDMHAAHERLTYERLKRSRARGGILSQDLVEPLLVEVSPKEYAAFEDARDVLAGIGFACEDFGGGVIAVRSVPQFLQGRDAKRVFLDVVQAVVEGRGPGYQMHDLDARLAAIACTTSVKSGRVLSEDEVQSLLEGLDETGSPRTCPHGRPLYKRITRQEIERWLARSI